MLIYPAIDLLDGRCVRLRQGDYSRETVFSDDPASVARQWGAPSFYANTADKVGDVLTLNLYRPSSDHDANLGLEATWPLMRTSRCRSRPQGSSHCR